VIYHRRQVVVRAISRWIQVTIGTHPRHRCNVKHIRVRMFAPNRLNDIVVLRVLTPIRVVECRTRCRTRWPHSLFYNRLCVRLATGMSARSGPHQHPSLVVVGAQVVRESIHDFGILDEWFQVGTHVEHKHVMLSQERDPRSEVLLNE
jgi:hypothetical protein